MQCPRCNYENPPHAKFCLECGTPLGRIHEGGKLAAAYRDLERTLTEALEQQTATSEILRVISGSPTDEQPVFDAIVRSARRLCDAAFSVVVLTESGQQTLEALDGVDPAHVEAMRAIYPRPIARDTTTGRTILDRRIVHIEDSRLDPEYTHPLRDTVELRSILTVPIFREGLPLGAVSVWRPEARPFTGKQIALLQTFADQAVIAIENVRLFKELQARNREITEALEQQTATSEVLKVISRSTFDLQPVLQTLIENATRLCSAQQGFIFRADGDLYHLAVDYNAPPAFREWTHRYDIRPGDGSVVGRVALENRTVQILDAQADADWRARNDDAPGIRGVRTLLGVPMRREGALIGVIAMWRTEVQPFTDKQRELIESFADQAVIAIENVRLFTELQDKNRELTEAHARVTEALEQQTATSEILRVISQSPTDTQPVFDAIVERALRLSEATVGAVAIFDGELIHVVASNLRPDSPILRVFPMRPSRTGSLAARTVFERQIIHVPDALAEPEYNVSQQAAESGYRSVLSVPMLRDGTVVGTITVGRSQAGRYLDRQIALLQTFADQAVIAIENVRLFRELEARNADLTEALEQQTATSEILRAISSSPTDLQPVFDTIVKHAARFCGAANAAVFLTDGRMVH